MVTGKLKKPGDAVLFVADHATTGSYVDVSGTFTGLVLRFDSGAPHGGFSPATAVKIGFGGSDSRWLMKDSDPCQFDLSSLPMGCHVRVTAESIASGEVEVSIAHGVNEAHAPKDQWLENNVEDGSPPGEPATSSQGVPGGQVAGEVAK